MRTETDRTATVANGSKKVVLVVHFGDAQLRGSERCIFNHIRSLDAREYRVVLWSNHKALLELVAALSIEAVLADFYPPIGFNYARKERNAISAYGDLLRETWRLVQRVRPQLIVCNSLAPCQWMVPVSILLNIPLIGYLHTDYLPKSRMLSLAFGASRLVGVSAFTLQKFLLDGFPTAQSSVVLNGVDDLSTVEFNRAATRAEFGLFEDTFVVLSICALADWKKVDLIIESFELLSKGYQGKMALVIVGDGPERDRLQRLVVGSSVIFAGWRADVANMYAMSDCVVLASEREAFGLTIIEASALQIPVIAARAGGPLEIIEDGVGGILVEPGSKQSFADAMKSLRDSPSLREELGKNARARFERQFKVQDMTDAMRSVFDQVMCTAGGTTGVWRFGRLLYLTFALVLRKAMGRTA